MHIDSFKTIFVTFFIHISSLFTGRNNGGHSNTLLGEIVHCYNAEGSMGDVKIPL